MASFSKGTSFTDGVTGDVTAAKLHALVDAATPVAGLVTDRTAKTSVAGADLVLLSDSADSNNLKKVSVTNFANNLPTAVITNGTVTTLNSTAATITTGTIPTLVSTTLVTTGTGTAAAPAIVPTGDTNTGIFFPAADTIAFSEGGTEAMRIDSSGRVGVGVSSPAARLHVDQENPANGITSIFRNTSSASQTGSQIQITQNGIEDWAIGQPAGTSAFSVWSGRNAAVTGTERLRIDSSGNLLVGTTSANFSGTGRGLLELNGSTDSFLALKHGNTSGLYLYTASGEGRIAQFANSPLTFFTNNTERLRITSGGEVYIAGTTDQGAYNLQVNGTGVWGAGAYVNGSDSRIKEDIQPIASGLDVVEKLNPVTYKYKETWSSDQSIQSGFIAQELLTALDGQIYIDGVVQQGGAEGYYSVAYQNLIAVLTKAIQELKAENDSLKARVAALEAA